MEIIANVIDIHNRNIYRGMVYIKNGIVMKVKKVKQGKENYIMPGLIDSHIHIESSMTTPGAFAAAAVSHGTTGVICDPHEIANVLGIDGVKYMINDSSKVPLKFWFGAPSCVPATKYETSGAVITAREIEEILGMKEVKYMAEMMNYPGVIHDDPEVVKKLDIAKKLGKPVDGHAPGLRGTELKKYISKGITTDHECSSIEEAMEKISLGMKVLIREGSAARNLNALKSLLLTHPEMVMLCSDDLHPEMLVKRHINELVARLITEGYDLFDVIRSCTINPCMHYNIDAGLMRPGDRADFIVVEDYKRMNVLETWINGEKIFDRGNILFRYEGSLPVNRFNCRELTEDKIKVAAEGSNMLVIEAFDGELLTSRLSIDVIKGKVIYPDLQNDILKIVVKDRYNDGPPAVGFIKGFGLKRGAFASSVAHDSHNIISVGTNDVDIVNCINMIVNMKGGLAVSCGKDNGSLPLPVAGIMSDKPVDVVAEQYELLSQKARTMGCRMSAPFMTLSFMALLVIPELKLSDKGLFDGRKFCPVPLFVD